MAEELAVLHAQRLVVPILGEKLRPRLIREPIVDERRPRQELRDKERLRDQDEERHGYQREPPRQVPQHRLIARRPSRPEHRYSSILGLLKFTSEPNG